MPTKDTTWTIDDIETDGLVGSPTPTWDWGTEQSLSFVFEETPRDRRVGADRDAYDERYRALLAYVRSASLATTSIYQTQGRPRYEERLPAAAELGSLVVDVVPGADVIDVDAIWALVVAGTDESQPIGGYRQLSLDLVPLALFEEYQDRSAVQEALGSGVL